MRPRPILPESLPCSNPQSPSRPPFPSNELGSSRGSRARGARLGKGLALCAGLGLAVPEAGSACIDVAYDVEESISLEIAPGRNAEVKIGGMSRAAEGPSCSAWVSVPLSAFPSTRLATRPADVARSLRDAVEKMGATECEVSVLFDNDTGEEIAEHELCLTETFRFGERRVWSSGPEAFCWEPDAESLVSVE